MVLFFLNFLRFLTKCWHYRMPSFWMDLTGTAWKWSSSVRNTSRNWLTKLGRLSKKLSPDIWCPGLYRNRPQPGENCRGLPLGQPPLSLPFYLCLVRIDAQVSTCEFTQLEHPCHSLRISNNTHTVRTMTRLWQ